MRCAREEETPIVLCKNSVTCAWQKLQESILGIVSILRGSLALNFLQDDDKAERSIGRKPFLAELILGLTCV